MLTEPQVSPISPGPAVDWQDRLALVVSTLRDISRQTDPQAMVRTYASRMGSMTNFERTVSLSRRDLQAPWYRITRSTTWNKVLNPWKERSKLPTYSGGLFAEWIYGEQPRLINDLQVPTDDPAAEYFEGMRSAIAIPHFDSGHSLNFVVHMRREANGFAAEDLPQIVWLSGLFGRATQNLVLSDQLREAYAAVDRELKVVADIQRSLLPTELPNIPTLDLAAYYHTSRHAGGDYYDFFELPGGRWGVLIADVSGHGTPAAVIMAILHSIAHSVPAHADSPSFMMQHLNDQLTQQYTRGRGTFVTAFYGVYDPSNHSLRFARAGHPPPRMRGCSEDKIRSLDGAAGLPLGIEPGLEYPERAEVLKRGDLLLLYTDGITEAMAPDGELFGVDRLDPILSGCHASAEPPLLEILAAVDQFTTGLPATDDRTLLAIQVT